jgi:hypothetical protein
VNFYRDKGLFKIFAKPFEASYEDAEPTSQLKLINLHCNGELMSEFEGDVLNFFKCLYEDKYLNLWQKAAVCAKLVQNHLCL